MIKQLVALLFITQATAVHADAPNVATTTYSWTKAGSEISLKLPSVRSSQIETQIYTRIQKAANKFFHVELYFPRRVHDPKFFSTNEALFKAAQKESKNIDLKAPLFEYKLNTKTLTDTADLVSLQLTFNSNVKGAAHPNSGGMFINFNPKTGQFIDDLSFLTAEAQNKVFKDIQSQLEAKLKKGLFVKGDQLKALIPGHFGFKNANTLSFTFWTYDVAAYVYGPQTVEVPFTEADRK